MGMDDKKRTTCCMAVYACMRPPAMMDGTGNDLYAVNYPSSESGPTFWILKVLSVTPPVHWRWQSYKVQRNATQRKWNTRTAPTSSQYLPTSQK